jgi:hypothetical protein
MLATSLRSRCAQRACFAIGSFLLHLDVSTSGVPTGAESVVLHIE